MSHQISKLVRDKIPNFIDKEKVNFQVKKLDINAYKQALKEKLLEESQEVFSSENNQQLMEEIADVYEVIEAIESAYQLDKNTIQKIKAKKADHKGKFVQKLLLTILDRTDNIKEIREEEKYILNCAEEFLQEKILPQANIFDR